MRQRHLDGFNVQLFGEIDGAADGLVGFARQAENEVAVHDQSEFLAVLGELPCALDRRALLDVFQDLLVARFIANDEQSGSRLPSSPSASRNQW